MWFLGAIFR